MQVKADVGTVRDENALASGSQTLSLKLSQLLEEAGDVDDSAGADQVNAVGGDKAGGQDVEVVGNIVVDDRVAGVYSNRERLNGQPI